MKNSNNTVIFQLKRTLQDITSYKGDWKRAEIFNKYVSDMNKSIRKLGLIEFHFEPFHFSNTGKTINDIGYESLINHINILESMFPSVTSSKQSKDVKQTTPSELERSRIFIVHGRDRTAFLETENIVRRIGLEPIVLQRMANNGLSIIEKFEKYSNVRYAIVLLTPDDIGALNSEYPDYKFRARQNVIFELGFFMAN
nr:nucleotide-binding protein [Paenibacillus sp. N3.4]